MGTHGCCCVAIGPAGPPTSGPQLCTPGPICTRVLLCNFSLLVSTKWARGRVHGPSLCQWRGTLVALRGKGCVAASPESSSFQCEFACSWACSTV